MPPAAGPGRPVAGSGTTWPLRQSRQSRHPPPALQTQPPAARVRGLGVFSGQWEVSQTHVLLHHVHVLVTTLVIELPSALLAPRHRGTARDVLRNAFNDANRPSSCV